MSDRTPEKELAHAIYTAWMTDERWLRMDLATIARGNPMAFFWAEIAARAAIERIKQPSPQGGDR